MENLLCIKGKIIGKGKPLEIGRASCRERV